jgi:mannose-6-phosphate isomerase-like protein (cupin superfamily)
MTHRLLLLGTLTLTSLLAADDPAGFVYWSKGAPPQAGPKNPKFDNHSFMASHRDKDGLAELHENQTDIMVIQSGEATLVVGGELVDGKTVRPGEQAGSAIKGGVKRTLAAGDVVHIPPGMPHQMFLVPGTQLTYFVVKVNKP